jgi:hypothetical protein
MDKPKGCACDKNKLVSLAAWELIKPSPQSHRIV